MENAEPRQEEPHLPTLPTVRLDETNPFVAKIGNEWKISLPRDLPMSISFERSSHHITLWVDDESQTKVPAIACGYCGNCMPSKKGVSSRKSVERGSPCFIARYEEVDHSFVLIFRCRSTAINTQEPNEVIEEAEAQKKKLPKRKCFMQCQVDFVDSNEQLVLRGVTREFQLKSSRRKDSVKKRKADFDDEERTQKVGRFEEMTAHGIHSSHPTLPTNLDPIQVDGKLFHYALVSDELLHSSNLLDHSDFFLLTRQVVNDVPPQVAHEEHDLLLSPYDPKSDALDELSPPDDDMFPS